MKYFQQYNSDSLEKAREILNTNMEAHRLQTNRRSVPSNKHFHESVDNPKHVSWVHFRVRTGTNSVRDNTVIAYNDTDEMNTELKRVINNIVTNELLTSLRDGTIDNIKINVGP